MQKEYKEITIKNNLTRAQHILDVYMMLNRDRVIILGLAWWELILCFGLLLLFLSCFSNTLPQVGGKKMSISSSLERLIVKKLGESVLLKISASWLEEEETWSNCIRPCWVFSQTIWQSISKCLVCSWKTRLATMCKPLWQHYRSLACDVQII